MLYLKLGAVFIVCVNCMLIKAEISDWFLQNKLENITENLVTYRSCRLDIDCDHNSFCFNNDNARNKNGFCKCSSGYELLVRNRTFYACLKLAKWGESCSLDIQCLDSLGAYAKCSNSVCGCAANSFRYYMDGLCHQRKFLGDFCKTDANCLLDENSYGYCVDGICTCPPLLLPSYNRRKCIEVRYLGETCNNDDQCSVGVHQSICRDVCRCAAGYIISRNESICLKAATRLKDFCVENDQCSEFLQNSICINNQCVCPFDHHLYEDKCIQSRHIGDYCEVDEQCANITLMNCLNGKCECKPNIKCNLPNSSSQYNFNTNKYFVVLIFIFMFIYIN